MSITLEQAMEMDYNQIIAAIKDPATSQVMQDLMRNREFAVHTAKLVQEQKAALESRESQATRELTRPTTAELATEAQQMAAEGTESSQVNSAVPEQVNSVPTPTPAPVKTDHTAEDEAWKAAGVVVYRDAKGNVVRTTVEYQIFEEDEKTPIGRPTHFECGSLFEAFLKTRTAHALSTRAYSRLRRQKLTFQERAKTALSGDQIKAAATAALQAQDPTKMEEAILATIESQYKELDDKQAKQAGELIRAAIQIEFRSRHVHDYYNCQANGQAISAYLAANNLEFTLDNLEAAFIDLSEQGRLVPVPRSATKSAEPVNNTPTTATEEQQPAASTTANTPASTPAASAQATVENSAVAQAPAQAASTPGNEATVSTPAASANPTPAARRPGVNGSLPPGSGSAPRPQAPDPALARKEFMRMINKLSAEEMKRKRDTDPQFVKQMQIYGIKLQ